MSKFYRLGDALIVPNYTGSGRLPGWKCVRRLKIKRLVPVFNYGYTVLDAGTAIFMKES